ncbi:hypothetical protein [Tunicatimonas pelagia]|uniref:hypothetical protein n=1 Tax=Tunicatimonas pelagia TaxID=931531 RepID=UPI00266523B7|nr:hypothetical protein [Tunicatimonas pelagia]WKN41558.1 hypothetical protein P0M28_21215 [Tunicatimonas pelagia]
MNIPVLIAAIIASMAFLAHTVAGNQEALSINPKKLSSEPTDELQRNWIQSMCAFQMVTIDLLLLSVVLFLIALTDLISFEKTLTLSLSLLFLLWGVAWLLQLLFLTRKKKNYLLLSQWVFWLVCAVLLYFGAQVM